MSSSTGLPTPEGPGSVSGAPGLPAGFTSTFTSRYVDTGQLRLHAVTGGEGPPLLLVHGWPQTWYAWRMLMPPLARYFSVVAVDQRGIGLSDKPTGGYDTATLASDLVALMDALGHPRFALYGTDVGMPIAYALAADHRDRVDRLAVSEAPLPGISPSPPLFLPPQLNERLWHLAFNQLPTVNEQLVTGREDIFFGAEFDASAGTSYHKITHAFVDGHPTGGLTRDHILDNITLYWLTGTGASAARSYWEGGALQPWRPGTLLRRSRSRSASPHSPMRSSGPRAAGSSRPTPASPTSTRRKGVATSPPGNHPSCSRPRCGPRSNRCDSHVLAHGHLPSAGRIMRRLMVMPWQSRRLR